MVEVEGVELDEVELDDDTRSMVDRRARGLRARRGPDGRARHEVAIVAGAGSCGVLRGGPRRGARGWERGPPRRRPQRDPKGERARACALGGGGATPRNRDGGDEAPPWCSPSRSRSGACGSHPRSTSIVASPSRRCTWSRGARTAPASRARRSDAEPPGSFVAREARIELGEGPEVARPVRQARAAAVVVAVARNAADLEDRITSERRASARARRTGHARSTVGWEGASHRHGALELACARALRRERRPHLLHDGVDRIAVAAPADRADRHLRAASGELARHLQDACGRPRRPRSRVAGRSRLVGGVSFRRAHKRGSRTGVSQSGDARRPQSGLEPGGGTNSAGMPSIGTKTRSDGRSRSWRSPFT